MTLILSPSTTNYHFFVFKLVELKLLYLSFRPVVFALFAAFTLHTALPRSLCRCYYVVAVFIIEVSSFTTVLASTVVTTTDMTIFVAGALMQHDNADVIVQM